MFRVGVVGCSRVAERFHAPAFDAQPDCEVVAFVSQSQERAAQLAGVYGAAAYGDVDEMLDRSGVDLVVVTTTESRHLQPLTAALRAGKHVFIEKPLHAAQDQQHVTWDDFDAATAALGTWNRSLSQVGVNFNYRTLPHAKLLQSDLSEGRLGSVRLVEATVHLACWSHTIDLIRWSCGEIVEVFASWTGGDGPERAVALRLADGATGTLAGSVYNFQDDLLRLQVHGSLGRGLVEGLNGSYRRRSEQAGEPDVAWPRRDFGNDLYGQSFRSSIDAFCEALRRGAPPPVTADDGLAELAVEAAIQRSGRTGQPCRVPLRRTG
jgi:predicted dehydrogenase